MLWSPVVTTRISCGRSEFKR